MTEQAIAAFDNERKFFVEAFGKLLRDETVVAADKALELESTIDVLRIMAQFAGVPIAA